MLSTAISLYKRSLKSNIVNNCKLKAELSTCNTCIFCVWKLSPQLLGATSRGILQTKIFHERALIMHIRQNNNALIMHITKIKGFRQRHSIKYKSYTSMLKTEKGHIHQYNIDQYRKSLRKRFLIVKWFKLCFYFAAYAIPYAADWCGRLSASLARPWTFRLIIELNIRYLNWTRLVSEPRVTAGQMICIFFLLQVLKKTLRDPQKQRNKLKETQTNNERSNLKELQWVIFLTPYVESTRTVERR